MMLQRRTALACPPGLGFKGAQGQFSVYVYVPVLSVETRPAGIKHDVISSDDSPDVPFLRDNTSIE